MNIQGVISTTFLNDSLASITLIAQTVPDSLFVWKSIENCDSSMNLHLMRCCYFNKRTFFFHSITVNPDSENTDSPIRAVV